MRARVIIAALLGLSAILAPSMGKVEEAPDTLGAPGPEHEAPLRLIVIDAAPYGIDPVVGEHVSAQMRETGAALGYDVLDRSASVAAAQRLRMPYPPAPANLWQVTYVADCARGTFARVWAHAGEYVVEVTVASLDGTGPWFARGTAPAEGLRARVESLLREALPPPETWQGRAVAPNEPVVSAEPTEPPDLPEPRANASITRRWYFAAQGEVAFGTSRDSFINGLAGTRVDYRVSSELLFGLYLGYANLRGRNGRANNLLTYVQVEDRVRIASGIDLTLPLRFALGYLPYNGPFVRLSAGLNIPLSEKLQLGFDLIAPSFWVLPDRTAVSLNVATELLWRP